MPPQLRLAVLDLLICLQTTAFGAEAEGDDRKRQEEHLLKIG